MIIKKPASKQIKTLKDRLLGSLNDMVNEINVNAHVLNISKCEAFNQFGDLKGDIEILPTSKLVAECGGLVTANVCAIKSTNKVIEQALSSQVCMKICII